MSPDKFTSSTTNAKPKLLVVTELYPKNSTDFVGGFVRDQLLELRAWYTITVITVHHAPSLRHPQPTQPGYRNDEGISVYSISYYPWWLLGLGWFKLISLPRMLFWNKFITKIKIQKLVRKLHTQSPFNLVHGHETYFGDEAGQIGKILKIPSVFTLHGLYSEHQHSFGKPFMKQVMRNLRKVDTLLAVSSVAASSYNNLLHTSFTCIPNGLANIQPENIEHLVQPFLQDRKLLLSIGALTASKSFDLSIRALTFLQRHNCNDAALIIVGSGKEQETLSELIRTSGLEQSVLIIPFVSRSEARGLIERANIILHPSTVESFCLVAAEGMSAGKPVIITKNIGLIDYLTVGKDIIAVSPNSSEEFSAAVLDLVQHPEKASRIGEQAKVTAQQFSWAAVATRLHGLYQALIARSL